MESKYLFGNCLDLNLKVAFVGNEFGNVSCQSAKKLLLFIMLKSFLRFCNKTAMPEILKFEFYVVYGSENW